jgi:hypothetical protein
MAKSKMDDVMNDMLGSKDLDIKEKQSKPIDKPSSENEAYIRVNFFISRDQKKKLRQYAKEIAPAHLKVNQSQLVRYMIENFDVSRARGDFFKTKY